MSLIKRLTRSNWGMLVVMVIFLSCMGAGVVSRYAKEVGYNVVPEYSPFATWMGSLSMSPFVSVLIQTLLLLFNFALIYGMVRRYEMTPSLSYFPSFFYLLLLAVTVPIHMLQVVSVASVFLLLAYISVFDCYHQNRCNEKVFNATFYYVTASLFLPSLLLFLPLVWLLFNYVNTLTIKRLMVSLSGAFFAFFLLSGILFLSNRLDLLGVYFQSVVAPFGIYFDTYNWVELVFLGMEVLMFLVIITSFRHNIQREKNSVRAYLSFLIITWLLELLMMILFSAQRYSYLMLSYIPFSIMAGHFYTVADTRMSRILLALLILALAGYFTSFFL